METIGKAAQDRIREGLDTLLDRVQQGDDPTQALAKIASEMKLPRGHIPHLARVYNISRMEHQRMTASTLNEKLAHFPLADAEQAVQMVFPDTLPSPMEQHKQAAISSDYDRPPVCQPRFSKAAKMAKTLKALTDAAPPKKPKAPPDPLDGMTNNFSSLNQIKKENRTARTETSAAWDKVSQALTDLHDRLCKSSGAPVGRLRKVAEFRYGDRGVAVVDYLVRHSTDLAKVACEGQPWEVLDPHIVAGLDTVMSAAKNAETLAATLPGFQEKLAAAEERLIPFTEASCHGVLSRRHEKQALGAFSAVMGTTFGRELGAKLPSAKSQGKLEEGMLNELTDPQHESELRNAQVGSMLNEFLTDDPVIRAYPPTEVVDHFNGISQIMPHATQQTEIMRALLRKRLQQGSYDMFDLDTALKMEVALKNRDKAPDSRGVVSSDPYDK